MRLLQLLDDFRNRYVSVNPSQSWLADRLGLSLRSISLAVRELKRLGLLLVVPRYRDRKRLPNLYQLMAEPWEVAKLCAETLCEEIAHIEESSEIQSIQNQDSTTLRAPAPTLQDAILAAPLTADDLAAPERLRNAAEAAVRASGRNPGTVFGCWQWLARLAATATRVSRQNGRGDGLPLFRWLVREKCQWHTDDDLVKARAATEGEKPKPKPVPAWHDDERAILDAKAELVGDVMGELLATIFGRSGDAAG